VKVHLSLLCAVASIISTTTIPKSAYAEEGCPSGLYDIGGGYCRDIKCYYHPDKYSASASKKLKKYGKACNEPNKGNPGWGDIMVPKR